METTWKIIGTEGQFAVVEYMRDGKSIILQILPPTPLEEETEEQALEKRINAHMPTVEQFAGAATNDPSRLVGIAGPQVAPSPRPAKM